jgi:radical SAM superfamily enzyme YgiQ (UPF0313 family)
MKVLLINPPIRVWSKPNAVPMGLGCIASVLRNAGHEVELLDINAYRWAPEEVEKKIQEADYDIAGIGAIVTVYKYAKWLIKLLKKYHPTKKIMIGGSVGTSIPEIMLKNNAADIVCIGEGELTVVDLVSAIEQKRSFAGVDGIWFKDDDGKIYRTNIRPVIKDMDTIPYPAWDLFAMNVYKRNPIGAPNKKKWIDGEFNSQEEVVSSTNFHIVRGCPYKCIYCYHDFMGAGYRHRSAEFAVKEMRFVKDKYGIEYFQIPDDLFCADKKFVFEFCDRVKKEFKGEITWGCGSRVNLMNEELYSKMADAGCVLIGYGIESGSQKMLDRMKKGATVEQARKAMRLSLRYIQQTDCSFILGLPGETRETIQETIDFCKDVNLTPEVIFFATPYPGTELYEMALREGKIKNEEEYLLGFGEQGEKVRVNFTDFTDTELYKIQEDIIKELGAWNKLKHPEMECPSE